MRRNWLLALALLLAVFGLVRGVTVGALWDPYEVSAAELSRRIGLNLLGGADLAAGVADDSVPIRADLGRGELPFTSAAVGFRLLGLSAWAGRLPLLLWALLALVVLGLALRRLWDWRSALYATLILATTPLYFLQARALLGDAVTLASFTIAWAGLSAACFAPLGGWGRAGFGLAGIFGLYAGFWCRGPLVNVAAPALAVGLAALLQPPSSAISRVAAIGTTLAGVVGLALGVAGLSLAERTGEYSVFVGSALSAPAQLPTFDVVLGNLAHAAFPWSALAPLALLVGTRGSDQPAEKAAIQAAVLGLAFGLGACAWLGPLVGVLVVPSVACFAVLVAVALRKLETGRLGSPLLALCSAALCVLVAFDLRELPDKLLVGFGASAKLPESVAAVSKPLWLPLGVLLAALLVWCLAERERAPDQPLNVFERAEYSAALSRFQRLWNGNLLFALLLLETSLVGFLLFAAIGERIGRAPPLDGFGSFARDLAAVGAIVVPLSPLFVLGAMALRDMGRVVFNGRAHAVTRAQGVLLACAAVGGVGSLGFYPKLARAVSPTEAFERYRERSRQSEPLGVLGEQAGAARYQGAPRAESFQQAEVAFEWLVEPGDHRRWLVLRDEDLAALNGRYRALRGRNLPILDARSSELLLAVSELRAGETNENPLASLVLDQPPTPQNPLRATLGDELEALGFSLRGPDGKLATVLVTGQRYRLTTFWRVRAPLRGSWQIFVHLDGLQRRFNADHEPLGGKYPGRLWRRGDLLADTTDVALEPNFAPGSHRLYFGFFSGDRRLPVREGPADDDRVVAGTLQVR